MKTHRTLLLGGMALLTASLLFARCATKQANEGPVILLSVQPNAPIKLWMLADTSAPIQIQIATNEAIYDTILQGERKEFEITPKESNIRIYGPISAFGCPDNGERITGLQTQDNPLLKVLNTNANNLTELDISENLQLEYLTCENNRIENLDPSNNCNLKSLDCSGNKILHLNLEQNPLLELLDCSQNELATLTIGPKENLIMLDCSSNSLLTLNLAQTPALLSLACANNLLTALDISSCHRLSAIDCRDNPLTSLDLSNNPDLNLEESSLPEGIGPTNTTISATLLPEPTTANAPDHEDLIKALYQWQKAYNNWLDKLAKMPENQLYFVLLNQDSIRNAFVDEIGWDNLNVVQNSVESTLKRWLSDQYPHEEDKSKMTNNDKIYLTLLERYGLTPYDIEEEPSLGLNADFLRSRFSCAKEPYLNLLIIQPEQFYNDHQRLSFPFKDMASYLAQCEDIIKANPNATWAIHAQMLFLDRLNMVLFSDSQPARNEWGVEYNLNEWRQALQDHINSAPNTLAAELFKMALNATKNNTENCIVPDAAKEKILKRAKEGINTLGK